jgi:hypothetical protein
MGSAPKCLITLLLIAAFPLYWCFSPQLTAAFLPPQHQQFRFVIDLFVYFCLLWFLLLTLFSQTAIREESDMATAGQVKPKQNKIETQTLMNTVIQERCRQEGKTNGGDGMRGVSELSAVPLAGIGVNELVQTVVQERLRMMKTMYERDDHSQQSYSNKIQKAHFREDEIDAMRKAQKSKKSDSRKPRKTTQVVQQQIIPPFNISFKILKELDWILPSIEGTFGDFHKAVEKFGDTLTPFLNSREETKIADFLEKHRYSELVDFLEKKANKHQSEEAVAALLAGSTLKRLQYGRVMQEKKQDNYGVSKSNLKLYKEIYCLLQELFVRYVNDARKSRYKSFDEVLDAVAWEVLEELEFSKNIEELGKNILEVLVEDFLSSLKPPKRQFLIEYRSFRMALRSLNTKDSLEAGRLLWNIVQEIHATYDSFQKYIAVQGQEEISQLVKVNQIVSPQFKKVPKEQAETTAEETSEKELRETIFAIIGFLNWMPQERDLVSEEDSALIDYFNKLLYSRRTRLNIVRDTQKKGDMAVFEEKLQEVIHRVEQSEQDLRQIQDRYQGKLTGIQVEIATPCQSEDYFPVRGIIDNVSYEPLHGANMIKLEVEEANHLKSFVVYTGNNVKFSS